ncbi:unnamed protein product [Adineta steineri]|uniref:Uncharacterized protein n=1 Tax=Adineta steineri TaxID=433720 RepID=A0A819F7N1_9BILA|nr:unnamed protein product [Adineta steineri]CAF3863185.1 unnamed protein product [Adineta steineri]
MIYSCQSFCGGWGDRLRGILSVYNLALLTNRHFMIDMNYPCEILKKSKNRTRLNINTMRSWQTAIRNEIANTIKPKDFVQIWSSYNDIVISTNSDYVTPALHNKFVLNQTRKLLGRLLLAQAAMQTLFAFLFELLFTPSISVRNRLDTILAASRHRHLICLHIRPGKNPTNPFDHAFTGRVNTTKAMLNFTNNYLSNKSS